MPAALLRPKSRAVRLPGTSGNYISTPDSVLNSITGDIDIRVCVKMADWTPATIQTFVGKYGVTNSYLLQMAGSAGILRWVWVNAEGTVANKDSTIAVSFADGVVGWVRVTHDVDNGAGQNVVTFYTSTDGITWTILGAARTTTGVTTIKDTTDILELGSWGVGLQDRLNGTIYYAEVRNGIDGPVVVKFDSSQVQVSGAMLPASINGWTWNGTALYKRDDYVRLPGVNGNHVSTPDSAVLDIVGDVDIRAKLSMDDWTPAGNAYIVTKLADTTGGYGLRVDAGSGTVKLLWATAGVLLSAGSTVAAGIPDGKVKWIRVTLDVDNGAAGNDVKFYTSDDGVTWVQLGATVTTAGVTAIANNGYQLRIGEIASGSGSTLAGNVYYAEVRNGINGPVVASFNAADNQVQTPWTINGSGWNWEGSSFTGKPAMALQLPGTSGNYASTPDTAGNSVVGDIDIRAKIAASDWTPATALRILSKRAPTQISYDLFMNAAGGIEFQWSADGTNIVTTATASPAAVPFADGSVCWVRVTLDVDDGSSQNVVTYYTSIDGVTWTLLGGTRVTAGVTSIFNSTTALEIGELSYLGRPFNGKVYYAEVRNGIDGPIVAKFDSTNIARTGTRTPTTTVQPGGTPNLLTPNQASIETDASGWFANDANTTVARSTAQFLDGAASLSITSTGAAASSQAKSTSQDTISGKYYTATAWARSDVASRNGQVEIRWGDAADALISTSNFQSSLSTTGFTVFTVSGVAPPTARKMSVKFSLQAPAGAGEVIYIDRISLVEAAEVWTFNGSAWDHVNVPQLPTKGRVLEFV